MTYTQTMTAALFLVFLGRLLRSTTGKVFLIVDRLRAHMTPAVQAWVAAHRDRIEVFYLPRYAPELNPDEYLNNDLKGQVNATGLPHDKGEVRSQIQEFMRRLLHLPEHVMSYFQHPSRPVCRGHQLVTILRAEVIACVSASLSVAPRNSSAISTAQLGLLFRSRARRHALYHCAGSITRSRNSERPGTPICTR